MILSVVNFINPFPTWLHFQELFMSPRLAATSIIDWHEKSQADHTSSTDCMLALYQGPPHLRNSPSEDILVGVFAHDGQSGIAAWAQLVSRHRTLTATYCKNMWGAAWHRMARRCLKFMTPLGPKVQKLWPFNTFHVATFATRWKHPTPPSLDLPSRILQRAMLSSPHLLHQRWQGRWLPGWSHGSFAVPTASCPANGTGSNSEDQIHIYVTDMPWCSSSTNNLFLQSGKIESIWINVVQCKRTLRIHDPIPPERKDSITARRSHGFPALWTKPVKAQQVGRSGPWHHSNALSHRARRCRFVAPLDGLPLRLTQQLVVIPGACMWHVVDHCSGPYVGVSTSRLQGKSWWFPCRIWRWYCGWKKSCTSW